ncbi:hypothetical protein [Alicyclobacillus fodiniaquatilis]|uniref:DeoR C terminal sensor domain-containing protein n=1 Tax=Alicyclobacillus fodiniaquatilis TaxID=1661150 RepID=A0ABW4JMA4_9BACL
MYLLRKRNSSSDYVILLADKTKFGKRTLQRICGLEKINLLITNAQLPTRMCEQLAIRGVAVEVV